MDSQRGYEEDRSGTDHEAADQGIDDPSSAIGTDERRMHVRAYNHWVSLLRGRAYPSIEDLDPANIADFGPHSVLLDFTAGIDDPGIAYLGRALRDETGLDLSITHISEVPSRSLLSRLTDHYLQIIANRAPIGFEAEFVGTRGHNTMYRGILMPFSSNDDTIDFIYGVINWKELADAATQKALNAEVDTALRTAPKPQATAPVWADGPAADVSSGPEPEDLAGKLAQARETAHAATTADTRSRAALYRALGRAHDFGIAAEADAGAYEQLLADAGVTVQDRAPMTAVAKLVFGADYDKARLTEFAAVLAHARRHSIPAGQLTQVLETVEGGIKAVVAAERAARNPDKEEARDPLAEIAERLVLASVEFATGLAPGELVVMLGRTTGEGTVDIVASVANDRALAARTLKAAK
ncbi:MAG: PAS domain-containing protein [Sphingomonas sp.]|uniref:PAS domain-containing protein n=1 Tax=Sphingomonas sp. TaxID=28214 RepID=UPI003F81554B